MSAIVCGKRLLFEDLDTVEVAASQTSALTPSYKRARFSSSTSPPRLTCSLPVRSSLVDKLTPLFPNAGIQLLEKALEDSDNDLDSATKSLYEHSLEYFRVDSSSATEENAIMDNYPTRYTGGDSVHLHEPEAQKNLPVDGAEWVELIVKEMSSATSMDVARSRAASVMESLENFISSRAKAEVSETFHRENLMLKEQMEVLLRDNTILKRAVAIQHERQKENDAWNQEAEQLKQLVVQYQEQLRILELKNYALGQHLRQAQQINSTHGNFQPDVY